ncbi:hypothetical protein CHARACLAT_009696 [Characodon lateralis]|uniref:Uncharacterized protein n=1 Tax=Characodon lateralis TaxID=208331 RepID=A0ABU7ESV2_9TELE|nr:hypothetical protein [Characodon lateralis]
MAERDVGVSIKKADINLNTLLFWTRFVFLPVRPSTAFSRLCAVSLVARRKVAVPFLEGGCTSVLRLVNRVGIPSCSMVWRR